jgi:hypothetical protein
LINIHKPMIGYFLLEAREMTKTLLRQLHRVRGRPIANQDHCARIKVMTTGRTGANDLAAEATLVRQNRHSRDLTNRILSGMRQHVG